MFFGVIFYEYIVSPSNDQLNIINGINDLLDFKDCVLDAF